MCYMWRSHRTVTDTTIIREAPMAGHDTLKTRRTLTVGGTSYDYYSLEAAQDAGLGDVSKLPYSIKVLLENLLRFEDGRTVSTDDVKACATWAADAKGGHEIA